MSDQTGASEFSDFPRDRLHVAGWQTREGEPTVPYQPEPTPVDQVDYDYALSSAHRVLYRFDEEDDTPHWYWIMGGVEDADQAVFSIIDLQLAGGYPELAE